MNDLALLSLTILLIFTIDHARSAEVETKAWQEYCYLVAAHDHEWPRDRDIYEEQCK